MKTTKPPRRQPEAHATRIYLLVDRKTGRAFDCALTRVSAASRRKAFAERATMQIEGYTFNVTLRSIRIVPATATPKPAKSKGGAA